jgi:hypothetical protein
MGATSAYTRHVHAGGNMPADNELQMQALDIETMAWDDLQREVITADPDATVPPFSEGANTQFLFDSAGCSDCECGGGC